MIDMIDLRREVRSEKKSHDMGTRLWELKDNGQGYGNCDDNIYSDLKGKHDPAFLLQFFHRFPLYLYTNVRRWSGEGGYEIVTIGVAFVI